MCKPMDNAHIFRKYCDAGFVVVECFFHGHCWRATLLGHVWFGLHGYCSVARPIGLAQSVVISNGSLTGQIWAPLWLGMVWALLPCGLLYSALLVAMFTAGALQGAMVMAMFALGGGLMLTVVPWVWSRWGHAKLSHQVQWRKTSISQTAPWQSEHLGTRVSGLLLTVTAAWGLWTGLTHATSPWCLPHAWI